MDFFMNTTCGECSEQPQQQGTLAPATRGNEGDAGEDGDVELGDSCVRRVASEGQHFLQSLGEHAEALMSISERLDPRLQEKIPFAGCGPRCRSGCLREFCMNAPTEANRLFTVGRALKERAGNRAECGVYVQATSIRSTGVGLKSARTMDKAVVLRAGRGETAADGAAADSGGGGGRKKRIDFLGTGAKKRKEAFRENA